MILEKQFNLVTKSEDTILEDIMLHVMVDYYPESGIDEILNVSVTDHSKGGINIVLTELFDKFFSKQLDEIVESIDWLELYREKFGGYNHSEN